MEMEKAIEALRKAVKANIEPSEVQRLARKMAVHAAMGFSAEEIRFTTPDFRAKIAGGR